MRVMVMVWSVVDERVRVRGVGCGVGWSVVNERVRGGVGEGEGVGWVRVWGG